MDSPHSKQEIKNRCKLLFLLICIAIMVFIGRLFWVQILQADFYQQIALDQRIEESPLASERGEIRDRYGEELAVTTSAETIIAYPDEIDDPAGTADELAGILSLSRQAIRDRLGSDRDLIFLERQVSDSTYEKIMELELSGVSSISEPKREYPRGRLAGQIVGFTGIDNFGLEGIENYFDGFLSGEPGLQIREIDAMGDRIPFANNNLEEIDPREGHNLYLTIDETIQYYAESALGKAMDEYNISGGSIIVMDPDSADILSMANKPDFDPGSFSQFSSERRLNKAVHDTFEPGSIFKVFTASQFLEQGYINFGDMLYDPGEIVVDDSTISCWSDEGHGEQNFIEVFADSCNPGFVQMGLSMEGQEMLAGLEKFNFGDKTGIKMPGEASGQLEPRRFTELEQATISFGHGLSTTPLQLVTAAASIANGGNLYRPRLVDRVVDNDGKVVEDFERELIRQAVSERTAEEVRKLMREAVKNGTGTEAEIDGYDIAGKTGTSRLYGDEDIYNTSFLGFLPGDDPEYVILVALYDLEGEDYYASENAVPVFNELADDIIRHKNLPPARERLESAGEKKENNSVKIEDYRGEEVEYMRRLLRKEGLNVKLIGEEEYITAQRPLPAAEVSEDSTVYLYAGADMEADKTMVPDFRGMDAVEAEELARQYGLRIDGVVEGEVNYQYPEPGKRVEFLSEIELE